MIIKNKLIMYAENDELYNYNNNDHINIFNLIENIENLKHNLIIYYNDLNFYGIKIYLYLNKLNYKYYNNINLKSYTYNTFIDVKNNISYIMIRNRNRWVKFLNLKKIYDTKINKKIFFNETIKIIKKYGNESTIGNYAIKIFENENKNKNIDLKKYYDILSNKEFAYCDNAYRSGLNLINNKYKNIKINNVNIIDINSLYPYIMLKYNLPVRRGVYYKGKYKNDKLYNYYIQHIKVNFKLKKDGIAFLSNKNIYINNNIETSEGRLYDLFLTNFDLENFKKNYDIYEIYYIDGFMYASNNKLFKNYVNKFYKLKNNTKNENKKHFYKLLLNSLYGRLCTKKSIIKKEPKFINNKIIYKTSDDEIKTNGGYIPVGVFITSIARSIMLDYINLVDDDFIYCDTDSIHFLNYKKNIKNFNISKKIGDFKIEIKNGTAKYLKLKTYIIFNERKIKKVVAGAPAESLQNINIDNFKINKKITISKNILKNNEIIQKKYIVKI